MTEYTTEMFNRSSIEKLEELSKLRNISIESLIGKEVFYVTKDVELMLPRHTEYLTDYGLVSKANNRLIFNARWIIPIRDTDGGVLNYVGYSHLADERYLYGTSKNYLRRNTLYGLENMNKAYQEGYAIICEGITDAIALHSLGYEVAFGNCGTFASTLGLKQLNRLKYGVIVIPDRDRAGANAVKQWIINKHIKLNTPLGYKDIADLLQTDTHKGLVKEYLDFCIGHLKASSKGQYEITMMF